jgi:hypothetical protein
MMITMMNYSFHYSELYFAYFPFYVEDGALRTAKQWQEQKGLARASPQFSVYLECHFGIMLVI